MFATGSNKGNTERPLNLYYGVCFCENAARSHLKILYLSCFKVSKFPFIAERLAPRRTALLIALFGPNARIQRTKYTFPSLMYFCHLKIPQPVCLQILQVNLTTYIYGLSRDREGRKEGVWGCCLCLICVCFVMIWVRMKGMRGDNSIFACFKTDVSKRWVLTWTAMKASNNRLNAKLTQASKTIISVFSKHMCITVQIRQIWILQPHR